MKLTSLLLLFLFMVEPQMAEVTPTLQEPPDQSPAPPVTDSFLGPAECLNRKMTRASCGRVFCPPWQRCIQGQCSCKPAYLCPSVGGASVCGRNHYTYKSYCQAMAVSCRLQAPIMSHFGSKCDAEQAKSWSSVDAETGLVKVFLPRDGGVGEELLVCAHLWDAASANVACREAGDQKGAGLSGSVSRDTLEVGGVDRHLSKHCVSIRCHGYEMSLSECEIHNKENAVDVAVATCYNRTREPRDCGFECTNRKCIALNRTCDGVDDCGDRSDEMCCKQCRGSAFRCPSGVCLHADSVADEQIDCLDGHDESKEQRAEHKKRNVFVTRTSNPANTSPDFVSRRNETRTSRTSMEVQLSCGVPNMLLEAEPSEHVRQGGRVKRVVGGVEARPTQIQWQVAVQERRQIDCGGAYIGGCWVLTAAHCVSHSASAFKVKFSLWKKTQAQGTTDIVPVQKIIIHPKYKANTYENDIALIQLQTLPFTDQCLEENPAVSAVCVPWTEDLFQANHTCSISGWGRMADGRASRVLRWGNVSLIDDCEQFYGSRLLPGMMCAGDLDGSVDSCQGDSGGPLVCQDALGVSYLWGIVSWGERCGAPGFPGIYTKVAHYFEWIRFHTGWSAITKFNN